MAMMLQHLWNFIPKDTAKYIMTATSMVQITHLSKEEMSPAEFTCNKKALALD